jgi:hypothetical protein
MNTDVCSSNRKLVFRTRKPALEDIWAPCCYDEECITIVRTMLTKAMIKAMERNSLFVCVCQWFT